ncbi:MAG: hypothetical protein V2I33_18845, partial [Kangiellaceae bacterium]|nr:hypothetical protein [Kangiellaceae bacterium]
MTDFTAYPSATVNTWAIMTAPSSAVFTLFSRFWKYTEDYYADQCDWENCVEEASTGYLDLWISPCFAYSITFNEANAISAERSYGGGWVYFTYTYEAIQAQDFSVRT